MSFELIHTSVPRDLDGQSGFGVAAVTRELPRALRDALVAWSDGSELGAAADRAISYAVCHAGGAAWPVLTCVTRCGVDWSGRANRVAHHLVLEPSDRCVEGPIELARVFPFAREVPEVGVRSAPVLPRPRVRREVVPGVDPAWFDVLADRLGATDAAIVAVRLPQGVDPMMVLAAVTARVEPKRRWAVQWSTAPAFHAGRGLPSIVMVRDDDAQALDLARPAPSPRTVELTRPTDAAAAPQERPAIEQVAEGVISYDGATGASTSRTPTIERSGVQRTLREPAAAPRTMRWVPVVLFALAGLIMLAALGLLLW